jgi:hypothetical protein
MSNWTSALRPSFERVPASYGDWTSVTLPVPSTALTTSATAALNEASVARTLLSFAWTRTL